MSLQKSVSSCSFFRNFVSHAKHRIMKRTEILNRIIEEQKKVIANMQQTVDRYVNASDLDEDSTIDPDDLSRQAEFKDLQLRFEALLKEAKDNLTLVEKQLPKEEHEIVENGSLIELKNHFVFVGISVPKFTLDKKEVISISAEAPIYQEFKNKKKGDSVQFAGAEDQILALY